jgi:hypothetical protein
MRWDIERGHKWYKLADSRLKKTKAQAERDSEADLPTAGHGTLWN